MCICVSNLDYFSVDVPDRRRKGTVFAGLNASVPFFKQQKGKESVRAVCPQGPCAPSLFK